MKKLSIVIPCYNCATTLDEAIDSVYQQHLEIPFEIVMVDDGSTDETKKLIFDLAKKYPEIRYIFHEKNKGGGAARNSGINSSYGDLIFCLDSDNFFPPDYLQLMIDYLDAKKCDGVVIGERRFFVGNNAKKFTSHFNKILDRSLQLADLFDGSDTLLDNFLFTKESYLSVGGYPEHHGFDTQSFEVRFLSKDKKVYVCPGSIFYHRQAVKDKSYFERVYESGEYSLNFYYILEDIFFLLSPAARLEIINYDVFNNSKLGENNLKYFLDAKYAKNINDLFIPGYQNYLDVAGFQRYVEEKRANNQADEKIVRALYLYKNHEYKKALDLYTEILSCNIASKLLYFNILRCATALSGCEINSVEKETLILISSLELKRRKIDLNPGFIKKILIKVWQLWKKISKK